MHRNLIILFFLFSVSLKQPVFAENSTSTLEVLLKFSSTSITSESESVEKVVPFEPPLEKQHLKIIKSRVFKTSLPKHRSRELSNNHLVIIAADKHWKEITRVIMNDPRLVRAEVANKNGVFVLRKDLYRTNVSFPIVLPYDEKIQQIVALKPQWTGNEFVLKYIGNVNLK